MTHLVWYRSIALWSTPPQPFESPLHSLGRRCFECWDTILWSARSIGELIPYEYDKFLSKVKTFGNMPGNVQQTPAMVPAVCGIDKYDQLTLLVNVLVV